MSSILEDKLYQILNELEIAYNVVEHEAVFTMEEAEELDAQLPGYSPKNMLVKDKKSKLYYLVVLDSQRRLDEKELKPVAGWNKIRFAGPEDLMEILGLEPGSVSPFGLVNDGAVDQIAAVVMDKKITSLKDSDLLTFHPCRNTASLILSKSDLVKFLESLKARVIFE